MDLNCPYCNAELEVNHDDGFGYEENVCHEMECEYCNKMFVFQTSIYYSYNAQTADCLNDGRHNFKPTVTAPKEFTKMQCSMCDKERELTEVERQELGIGTKEDYFKKLKGVSK